MKINNNNYLTNVLLICVKIKIVFFSIFDLKQHDFGIRNYGVFVSQIWKCIFCPSIDSALSIRISLSIP